MADIDIKIEKIKKNCLESAKKELQNLKNENDDICNEKVLALINDYKDELATKYKNDLNKLEREYNKSIFDYEVQERKELNNFKSKLLNDFENKVVSELNHFTKSKEYMEFLTKSIEKTLDKIAYENSVSRSELNVDKCEIYITQNDYKKFIDDLRAMYKSKFEIMENDRIGGCLIMDLENGILIDNTLKNNLNEKIKQINL